MDQPLPLDLIGTLTGTDKASTGHGYLDSYERLFAPWRDAAINFIEIGVLHGASVAMWRAFFSWATIVGIDLRPECAQYAGDGVEILIGSQDDPAFLFDVCRRYPPSIVIDDGSHFAHHVLFTFERVFPYLAAGGLYVIEDVNVHLGPGAANVRGPAAMTPPEYLLDLSRRVMDGRLKDEEYHGFGRYVLDQVDHVTFIRHAAVIRKKSAGWDLAAALPAAERQAEASGSALQFSRLSGLVQTRGGPLDRAVALAQRAVELEPHNGDLHHRLALVLERDGRGAEALQPARASTELAPGVAGYWFHRARLHKAQRELDTAEASAQRAVALSGGKNGHYVRELGQVFEARGDLAAATETIKTALASAEAHDSGVVALLRQDLERLNQLQAASR